MVLVLSSCMNYGRAMVLSEIVTTEL